MSLLTIIQDAAVELGFAEPANVVTSNDPTMAVLLRLANKEGVDLVRRFDWQELQKEVTFTSTATATQTALATLATDFFRFINGSMWDRTQSKPIRGPLTAQEWQGRIASGVQAGVESYFRVRAGTILFNPVPPSGDTIAVEYIRNTWCQSSTGTLQTAFAADGDTGVVNEEIITLGIIWRYRKAKGFDYGEDFRTYEMALADVFGPNGARGPVDMTGDDSMDFGVNLPDGNWSL